MSTPEIVTPEAPVAPSVVTLLQERRSRYMEQIGSEAAAIFFSNPVRNRSNDADYDYRQNSDLWYLTGFEEPESVAVLVPGHPETPFTMFLRERDPKMEIWDGARLGVERACAELGCDAAHPISKLDDVLPALLHGREEIHVTMGRDEKQDLTVIRAMQGARRRVRRGRLHPTAIVMPDDILHEMRLIKTPAEIEAMRLACRVTAEGHVRGMRRTRPGMYEYQLQAEIEYHFKRSGALAPGYTSIVGAGANACVLHYVTNRDQMNAGDLVLVDAGAEVGYYTGDVTRTWPVNGEFTGYQRQIYDLVLRAQMAAIREVRPGVTWGTMHETTTRVITEGLIDLGLISGSLDEAIEEKKARDYFMHGTGHWLGIDVHDVGPYSKTDADAGSGRRLEPGMVFTIEPGIYFHPEHCECPDVWKGIGVRIEDNVLVTEDGCEVLTEAAPKEAEEIEAIVGQDT